MKHRISKMVSKVFQKNKHKKSISIKNILRIVGFDNSNYFIILFFTLPLAFPIPLPPGVSSLLTLPVLFITFQNLIGINRIFLPEIFLNLRVQRNIVRNLNNLSRKYIKKIEKKLKNKRMLFMFSNTSININKFILFINCGIAVFPIPMWNLAPGVSIMFICMGMLMGDGLMILIGDIISFLMMIATGLIIIYTKSFLVYLKLIITPFWKF